MDQMITHKVKGIALIYRLTLQFSLLASFSSLFYFLQLLTLLLTLFTDTAGISIKLVNTVEHLAEEKSDISPMKTMLKGLHYYQVKAQANTPRVRKETCCYTMVRTFRTPLRAVYYYLICSLLLPSPFGSAPSFHQCFLSLSSSPKWVREGKERKMSGLHTLHLHAPCLSVISADRHVDRRNAGCSSHSRRATTI